MIRNTVQHIAEDAMPKLERPEVQVRPSGYQPSKAELEADMSIDATPEALAERTLRPVTLRPIPKK